MRALVVAICVAGACAELAVAQTFPVDSPTAGWTYFNRPGATLAQHRADIEGCFIPVASVTPTPSLQFYDPVAANPGYYYDTYGAAGAAAGSLVVASIQLQQIRDAQNRSMVTNYENCMVARGWRLVRLDPAIGRRLNRLTQSSLELRLGAMIASEQPEGEIVRAFPSERAEAIVAQVDDTRSNSLSLLAMPSDRLATEGLRPVSPRAALTARSREERLSAQERARERRQQLEQAQNQARASAVSAAGGIAPVEDISALPSDASLVVVSANDLNLTFMRDAPAGADAPLSFAVSTPKGVEGDASPGILVFAVPPGRWRISHITGPSGPVAMCLGAPAFEVGANEVVFAGVFGETGGAPDMALAPAVTVLASAPDFAARLRPAAYINGNVADCGGASLLYAYEIPGAPFVEGYQWGSRASVTAAPQ
jgi:hypothetical protein